MNDQAIIFCQAPIETAQVLYIYEKIKPQYKNIIIACLRTKSYIDFFKYMKLEVQYIYIPEFIFSIKHILGNIKKISEIKHYAQTININESDIYFTSRFDEQLAFLLVYKKNNNKSYYIYDKDTIWKLSNKYKMTLKQKLYDWYLKTITKAKLERFPTSESNALYNIPVEKMSNCQIIYNKIDSDFFKKHSYKIPNNITERTVIFYSEPYRFDFTSQDSYYEMNKRIVDSLHHKGYKVALKGHPRIGVPDNVMNMVDYIIPAFIPAEFINLKDFTFAIGFVSTSLSDALREIPSYSVLKMCPIQNINNYNHFSSFLSELSSNKIKFIENFNEIPNA
jgi:hypothetical protein